MLCLEYNPKDPHMLVGGCYNGQLAVFDTRKGNQPVEVTPVEISHHDPIHKLVFPSSKTGLFKFNSLQHYSHFLVEITGLALNIGWRVSCNDDVPSLFNLG